MYLNNSLFPEGMGYATDLKKAPIPIVSLTDYNNALKMQGKPAVALKDNEYAVNVTFDQAKPLVNDFLIRKVKLKLNGKELECVQTTPYGICLQTSMQEIDTGTLIVPDAMVRGLTIQTEVLNVNYKPNASEEAFVNQLKAVYSKTEDATPYDMRISRIELLEQGASTKTMVSYLAIYIGLVFIITCAAVLALQQLSEASDNIERYGLLKKLGAEESMINHALFTQIAIYFFIPLALSIVHSIVGIHVANNVVSMLGHLDIANSTLYTALVLLAIYGGYFLATYFGCKGMIKNKKNME
jgi:putative ABC transport system permease protein